MWMLPFGALITLALVYASLVWTLLDPEGPYSSRSADFAPLTELETDERFPGNHWKLIMDPAQAGFDPLKLEEAKAFCKDTGASAIVVALDGKLLMAWGFPSRVYPCHSVRKSLISALFGVAAESGLVDLEASLGQLGIDERDPLTEQEKGATIRDLLMARSGIYLPSNNAGADMRKDLPPRGSHAPGGHWYYNNWDFNALGTIYQRLTGRTVFDAFGSQIAHPIGMEHFDVSRHTRWSGADASDHRAYEFQLSALDLARFGHLYLREGQWEGIQLVPSDWVSVSTSRLSEARDTGGGYGYMWWVDTVRATLPEYADVLEGSFSAEGMGGHMALVVPKLDMVVVVRANTWLPSWMPLTSTRVNGAQCAVFLERLLAARL
jgi:CubicO group peptidase (beta-lactamase class C family)